MIYDFCPFNNENIIANIKIKENSASKIVTCITESNKTFKYGDKNYCYEGPSNEKYLKYFKLDGNKFFVGKKYRLSRHPWFIKYEVNPWVNEEIQRNYSCSQINVEDDDYVILSDIDEIIDRNAFPEILELVKKHGIITIGLRFTTFYFNLFSINWPGPPRYSYRVFIMTGKKFKSLGMTSDQLRKMGESGVLSNQIFCHEGYSGFHHSWIGDISFIKNKLLSYAHSIHDHGKDIFHRSGEINETFLKEKIEKCESLFPDQELIINNDIKMLDSVIEIKDELSKYFV